MRLPTRIEPCELGRLHRPEGPGADSSYAGLVFVHDVWGPSEHSQALAADLASEGFAVLEIDLYRGLGDFTIEDPGAHIRSLSDPAILADLVAGADWLGEQPCCAGRKIGILGVCMGGTFTLLAGCLSDRFSAAAPFYGILSYEHGMLAGSSVRDRARKPLSPIEAAGRLMTPLLASFGCEDDFVPAADIDALEAALATSGVGFEIDRHSGAGHAFLNRTRPDAYREEASVAAWGRVIPFLHRELHRELD